MNTKSTVTRGPAFHLYRELGDDRSVHLRLDGVAHRASYDRVTVAVPVHVWEHVRRFHGVDLSLADVTDREIRERVEGYVDDRIARLAEADDESRRGLIRLAGSIPYGPADDPREEQVARGVADYERRRAHQREVRDAVGRLDRGDDGVPPSADEVARRALFGAERLLHNLRQDLDPDDPRRSLVDDTRSECRAAMAALSGSR